MRALAPALLVLLAAAASAQQASYTYIQQQPPYTNPSPSFLTALNLPQLGGTFQVSVPFSFFSCCPFQRNYYLATGTANPNVQFDPLGGYLYTNADLGVIQTFTNSSGGNQVLSFAIPNSPVLLGVPFHQQVLEHAWNSHWSTRVLSRGGHGVIGQ